MPSISSYSANPAFQSAWEKPACSHSRKRLWMALALPKRSLGNAFHWQPVRIIYTMASNTCQPSQPLNVDPPLCLPSPSESGGDNNQGMGRSIPLLTTSVGSRSTPLLTASLGGRLVHLITTSSILFRRFVAHHLHLRRGTACCRLCENITSN